MLLRRSSHEGGPDKGDGMNLKEPSNWFGILVGCLLAAIGLIVFGPVFIWCKVSDRIRWGKWIP